MAKFEIQYPASFARSGIKDKARRDKYRQQRKERGFDDTELWNLDVTFARLMLPRLRAFLPLRDELIVVDDKWHADMAAIILALEILSENSVDIDGNRAIVTSGMEAFSRNIMRLWY